MKKSNSLGGYRLAQILLLGVCLFNMASMGFIYTMARVLSINNMSSVECLSDINGRISQINEDVLTIVADIDENSQYDVMNAIKGSFSVISRRMNEYESNSSHSEMELRRYHQAKLYIKNYQKNLNELFRSMAEFKDEDVALTYIQEIYPVESTTKEMLMATIELCAANADKLGRRNSTIHGLAQMFILVFIICGEIIIYRLAKRAKVSAQELEASKSALDAAGERLEMSRQKMEDSFLVNILTGMRNRYALADDLKGRLENDQFNIAIFNLDNFKQINDTFGYDFGDAYISTVAEQLSDSFGDVCKIYNITGDEFCFIFNSDVPDSQAQRIAERIHDVMSSPYDIDRVVAQLTASGAIYHYLPNDCLNLDSLLIKMDNTVRQAKMNGGNAVYTVNSL